MQHFISPIPRILLQNLSLAPHRGMKETEACEEVQRVPCCVSLKQAEKTLRRKPANIDGIDNLTSKWQSKRSYSYENKF